jgi:ABC-2 type transport system permease protein
MIWYVIFTELLWNSLNTRQLHKKIVDDVKSGNIAYNITKPYNYINYILSSHFGEKFINFVVFMLYGLLLGFLFLGSFPKLTLLSGLLVLISAIISMVVNALITIIFGLFSFAIEDSTPLFWIYQKITLILGTVFPVEFFPGIMKNILKYSPIFAMSYGSARLFVDFNWKFAGIVFLVQGIYLVVIYLLAQLVYKKGVKKLNVNGG